MLILASASPRRRELLTQAGISFTVQPSDIPEQIQPDEAPAAFVARLALEKALAVLKLQQAADTPGDPLMVLGADTAVMCNGEVLGKPGNLADARRMLELLSGRTHQVLTGVAVATRHGTVSDVEITQVYFDLISESELSHYLDSGEPLDKAGAYGIQGYAARWIPKIEGCYFNVVGLPLSRTIALLAEAAESSRKHPAR